MVFIGALSRIARQLLGREKPPEKADIEREERIETSDNPREKRENRSKHTESKNV